MKRLNYLLLLFFLSLFVYSSESLYKREFESFKLDNGLEILMVKTKTQPIVTIQIAAKNGSYTQIPENCGLSHLYEHMFFKGNVKWKTQEEYNKRIRELGIIYNGMTSNESVRYFFTLPSKNLNEGLEFMSYAIIDPLFDSIELEKERKVVLNEFNRDFSNPIYRFYQTIDSLLYEKYFYRKNTIGTKNIIMGATREQMYQIKNRYYIPNNCALVIVGDIDFKETKNLVKKYFNRWEKGDDPVFDFPKHPPLDSNKTFFIVDKVSTSEYSLSFRVPDFNPDRVETYAMDLLSDYLSMKSSKLYKDLVESGLVYDYYVGYSGLKDGAEFSFYVDLKGENLPKVRETIFKHLKDLIDENYFDEKLLERARENAEVQMYKRLESSRSYALTLGYWWCVGGVESFQKYNERIKQVNSSDLKKVAADYLVGKNHVEVILTDSTNFKNLSLIGGEK